MPEGSRELETNSHLRSQVCLGYQGTFAVQEEHRVGIIFALQAHHVWQEVG